MTTIYNNDNALDNIKVIENFFPPNLVEELMDYIYLPSTRWEFHPVTADIPEEAKLLTSVVDVQDTGQYVNVLLLDGKTDSRTHPPIVYQIHSFLEDYLSQNIELLRIKLNRQQPFSDVTATQVNEPHWDYNCANCTSIVVYLTDAMGDTVVYSCTHDQLFSKHPPQEYLRVTPKTNRAVMLPSFLLHASSPARGLEERIVVNLIYRPKTN